MTPEQADVVLRGLTVIDRPGHQPDDVAAAEGLLTGFARTFGPRDLTRCVDRYVDLLHPDGSVPDVQLVQDRRHLDLRQQRDGSWRGEFRLTGPAGAKLQALLTPLTRPRPTTKTSAAGRPVEEPDQRTAGQRRHDALEQLCDRLLRSRPIAREAGGGDGQDVGGTPATVIVTIDEESLRTRTGTGTTTDGTRLTAAQVLELADQAEVIPTVLTDSGAVLSAGRTRRIASRAQTLALIARDRGCSFPGCTDPPGWCERHHIRAWVDGGLTDLDNLTLLCRYHHHNHASCGWTCHLTPDRIPAWTPPRHVDPRQRPLVNTRIQAAHLHGEEAA